MEIWRKQLGNDGYDIILGVRSSIFLPFHKLGLVIVDEEHENTYKQYDWIENAKERKETVASQLKMTKKTVENALNLMNEIIEIKI